MSNQTTSQREIDARERYSIKPVVIGRYFGKEEEGFCENCGIPQQDKDDAFEIWEDGHEPIVSPCCSRSCARVELERLVLSCLESDS